MGTYLESYTYDLVGNILSLQHAGSDPVMDADLHYQEKSQLEPSYFNNRVGETIIGNSIQTYGYDGLAGLHGAMTSMPQLSMIQWTCDDQIGSTARQVVSNGGTPETTYYVYDMKGIRVRKVTERATSTSEAPRRTKERIYLSDYEIFRKFA